jgi:hypothetical protein
MQHVLQNVYDIAFPLDIRENKTGFAPGQTLVWVIYRVRLASGCRVRL